MLACPGHDASETLCSDAGAASRRVRAAGPAGRLRCGPLRSLEGTSLAERFRFWTGRSGRSYVFSVFPLCPDGTAHEEAPAGEAVVIGVERAADDSRVARFVAETGGLPDLVLRSRRVADLRARPGGELHLHLTATDAAERRRIAADLTAG